MKTKLIPTHLYKGKQVEFVEKTYISNNQQYCTILMVNKFGKHQRQTIQERHLTPLALDGGDSAGQMALSTPEVLSPSPADSNPAPRQ